MRKLLFVLAVVFCVSATAYAYTPPNSAKILERVWNDDPDSVLTTTNNYPTYIAFDDQKLDGDGQGGEYANLHLWRFSSDGGATATPFYTNSFFDIFMDVKVSGDPTGGKDHEGGMYFETNGWDGKFMVKTNGEIAAFGNVFPFYAFLTPYVPGTWVKIGMRYFLDTNDGKRKIIYYAGGDQSPALMFGGDPGILNNTTFGGYGQLQIAPGVASNWGKAEFGNINVVPEPSSLFALAAGLGALGLRRRK